MHNSNELLTNFTGKKVLMTIFPHPDDETMAAGGLLMAAKKAGWKTVVVDLTQGGAGQVHTPINGYTLKQARLKELEKAAKILGVDELSVGDFDDGKLRIQINEWRKWLAAQIFKFDPGIIVSYDPSGVTGHPDHISVSLEVKKLAAGRTLWWTTLPSSLAKRVANSQVLHFLTQPDLELDLGWNWVKKWRAARAHRSQALGKGLPVPLGLVLAKYHYEWYHEVDFAKNYHHKFVEFNI